MNCLVFKFAIIRSPFMVTTANNSAFSGVGLGNKALKGTPFVLI